LAKQGGRLGQLDDHHLTRFTLANPQLGNQDILPIALVFRRDNPDAALVQQAANDRMRRSLDDLDHAPLWAAFAVLPHDAHLDAVLVQNSAHFVGRQVNIAHAIVSQHKTVTVAVPLHTAFNFFQRGAGGSHFFDIQSYLS